MAIAALAPVAHSRAASKRAEAGASLQLVGFRLADEEYGFEIMKVREIILVGSITRIPQSSPYVRGVINLRGLVIPIVDLRLRFGMSAQPDGDATRIIVTSCNGQTIGFVVDEVNEVLRVPNDQIAAPPTGIGGLRQPYITGIVRLDRRLLLFLDAEKLFEPEESAALAAIRK